MVQSKAKAVHTVKIADYLLFAAAVRENCDFILAVVEETWVRELREYVTDLLAHLKTLCGGLHALNFVGTAK